MRPLLSTLALLLLLAGSLGVATEATAQVIRDQYIVVLHDYVPMSVDVARDLSRRHGLRVMHVYEHALKGFSAVIPVRALLDVERDARVRFISEDRVVKAYAQTLPTGINRINAENKTNIGTGVHVAVIDTGIAPDHPDLKTLAGGKRCIGADAFWDFNGHGTHVAGTIAAVNNGNGVVGVAPGASLWAVRVLDGSGSGSTSSVVCGIDFVDSKSPAKGGPIKVANMSLGGGGSDDGNCGNTNNDPEHVAICRAVADGVTFVVAAGNDGDNLSGHIPAAYNEVITVTALGDSDGKACGLGGATSSSADDGFASFSNFGTGADLSHVIAAPGVDILSTSLGGGYATLSGTSMASPHVAGAAALYIATHPSATPGEVRDALMRLGEPPGVNFQGECVTGGASHTNTGNQHPEPVVRADTL